MIELPGLDVLRCKPGLLNCEDFHSCAYHGFIECHEADFGASGNEPRGITSARGFVPLLSAP